MAVLPIAGFKGVIEKIIFKQSNFVTDRTTTMQFRKMQFEIFGSLVQYSTTPNVPTILTQIS